MPKKWTVLTCCGTALLMLPLLLSGCAPAPPAPQPRVAPRDSPPAAVAADVSAPRDALDEASESLDAPDALPDRYEAHVVAMVNDEPIYERDVRVLAYRVLALHGLSPEDPGWFDEYRRLRGNILNSLIEFKLIDLEAQRSDIVIPDQEVDLVLNQVKSQFGTRQEWDDTLAREGLTEDEISEAYRQELVIENFKRQHFNPSNFTASEQEMRELYQSRPQLFRHPNRVGMQQLSIFIPGDATPEHVSELRALAQDLRRQFQQAREENKVVPFEPIGQELMTKGVLAVAQDDYVSVKSTDSDPVSHSLRTMAVGEISPVIEMHVPLFGEMVNALHIVQTKSHQESFESAREGIEISVRAEKAAHAMKEWIEELYEQADIRVVDRRFRQ